MYGSNKNTFYMEKKLFKSIQQNFRTFLTEKKNPTKKKEVIIEHLTSPRMNQEVVKLEKTTAFGSEDGEVGYKVSFIDRYGNQKTKIVSKPT